MRHVIRYQTSTILSAHRWRRKRKVAGAKQSIRRSRGGPPPSPRKWRWRRWRSTRRLKVTRATREKGFTTPARLFISVLLSSRMLVTGSETSARHAGLRDDFFRTMTGDSPSAHTLRITSDPRFRHSFAIVTERYASPWYFSRLVPTRRRHPEAADDWTCRSNGASMRYEMSKAKYQRVRLRDDRFICNLRGAVSLNSLCYNIIPFAII